MRQKMGEAAAESGSRTYSGAKPRDSTVRACRVRAGERGTGVGEAG